MRQPFYDEGLAVFTGGYLNKIKTAHHHRVLFDAITTLRVTGATRYHGAKTVVNSPRGARSIVAVLRRAFPGIKIVMVRRNDWVAQYGSVLQRARTGIAHSWRKGKDGQPWMPGEADPVSINPLLFRLYAMRVHETLEELDALRATHPVHVLGYEAYCRDPDAGYRAVLRFLELPYVAPTWMFSQKVSPPPRSFIRNYDGVTVIAESIRQGAKPSRPTLIAAKVLRRMQFARRWVQESLSRIRSRRPALSRTVLPSARDWPQ